MELPAARIVIERWSCDALKGRIVFGVKYRQFTKDTIESASSREDNHPNPYFDVQPRVTAKLCQISSSNGVWKKVVSGLFDCLPAKRSVFGLCTVGSKDWLNGLPVRNVISEVEKSAVSCQTG